MRLVCLCGKLLWVAHALPVHNSEGAREGSDSSGGDPVFVRAVKECIELIMAAQRTSAAAGATARQDRDTLDSAGDATDLLFEEFDVAGGAAAAAASAAATSRGRNSARVPLPAPLRAAAFDSPHCCARGAVIVFSAESPEDCSVPLRACFTHEVRGVFDSI